jgi:hypothetical protein
MSEALLFMADSMYLAANPLFQDKKTTPGDAWRRFVKEQDSVATGPTGP